MCVFFFGFLDQAAAAAIPASRLKWSECYCQSDNELVAEACFSLRLFFFRRSRLESTFRLESREFAYSGINLVPQDGLTVPWPLSTESHCESLLYSFIYD